MARAAGIVGEFLDLKDDSGADLLAMQVGDFYEFFGDDAETVASEIDLKLTEKSSGGSTYPMAGVPVDQLAPHLKALVERGYRVAVADQHETADGHARAVERVVTPGTLLETEGAEARYLAGVVRAESGHGVAFADVTTGRFSVTTVETVEDVLSELYRFDPVELLAGPAAREDEAFLEAVGERTRAALTRHDPNAFAPGAASHALGAHFGAEAIDSLGLDDAAVRAAGAVLDYVEATGIGVARSMTRLRPYRVDDHVELDATTQRNLELTETMTQRSGGSLLETIDHTVTSPGHRLLREWLGRPRRSVDVLERRTACVAAFCGAALERSAVREQLRSAADLERLATRTVNASASGRHLRRIGETLGLLPGLVERLGTADGLAGSPLADVVADVDLEAAADLADELDAALAAEASGSPGEGDLFARGYDDELDHIASEYREVRSWIDGLAERVKDRHGLTHVQVGRNRTDGYYLQVGKSEVGSVPEGFEEVKALKNSKRFSTPALRERERAALRLEEARAERERELFDALLDRVADDVGLLQAAGRGVAELDVYAALAEHASAAGWTRPGFDGDGLEIEAGRHPVVERTTEFVPNDAALGEGRRIVLVTGPNMSGKSTYLRQTALIVLLAQIGSFVPAESASIEPVDGIFSRVGALDELAQGRSTFMVEMQELSRILHAATEDSLVILDEVGRGTATFDGISIAWAATEYLHNEVGALTLFATHYHELTALAEHLPGVANVHVEAVEADGDVTFLRNVKPGPTDRSYGIHVAELAGVPVPVVDRARRVLDRLRREKAIEARGGAGGTTQAVFDLGSGRLRGPANADGGEPAPLDPAVESVLEELRSAAVDEIAPVELARRVLEWQDRLET